MKYKNVFWGLILILIGSLAIARNLDLLSFDWYRFAKLWPVIFILWGISVLPVRDSIKIGLLVVILGGSTWFVIDSDAYTDKDSFGYIIEDWNDNHGHSQKNNQNCTVAWTDSIKEARLNMDATAGSFYLHDTTDALIKFHQTGSGGRYNCKVKQQNDYAKIEIDENNAHVFYRKNNKQVIIKLNPNPVWDINLDAGASAVKYDLSAFKIRKLNIDGGAGSFKITLGDRYPDTYLTLDAGASSIVIRIPESSGCDLELSSVLSGKHLYSFQKIDDGHYQTANYDSATNKIHLKIDAAVSSFNIIRY